MASAKIVFECKKTWLFYPVVFLIKIIRREWIIRLLKNITLVNVYQGKKVVQSIKLSDFYDL